VLIGGFTEKRTSSLRSDPDQRESQAVAFLDGFPLSFAPVLIGGYAVAAHGPPRYSVDVDLTIPADREESVLRWLEESDIEATRTMTAVQTDAKVTKYRIERESCSGDLYFGGLISRPSGAFVPYRWIARDPRPIRLQLRSRRLTRPFPVARPAALWTLKLLAGRPQDLTDLFMMMREQVESKEVNRELRAVLGPGIEDRRQSIARALGEEKTFRDALSRREMSSHNAAAMRKDWERFREIVSRMLA
jgi:hypothetical protein